MYKSAGETVAVSGEDSPSSEIQSLLGELIYAVNEMTYEVGNVEKALEPVTLTGTGTAGCDNASVKPSYSPLGNEIYHQTYMLNEARKRLASARRNLAI